MQGRGKKRKVDNIEVRYIILLLVSVWIGSISQVLLKKAAMRQYSSVVREYLNPKVMAGYVLFALTSFLSVMAYKGVPLSMGPVLEATGYIHVAVFGNVFFGEKLNARKMAALALIIIGVIVSSVYGMG